MKQAGARTRSPSVMSSYAPLIAPPPALQCSNTLLSVFGPWLFEAASIKDPAFTQGRASAFSALCRIVCRRTEEALGIERLADFFKIIQDGLMDSDVAVHDAILLFADRIFSFDFPGVTNLAPVFLSAALRLTLSTAPKDASLAQLHNAALRIAYSLIWFPRFYGSLELGASQGKHGQHANELRGHISTMLPLMYKTFPDQQTRQLLLWVLFSAVLEAGTPDDLDAALRILTSSLLPSSGPAECIRTAWQCFTSLADHLASLEELTPTLGRDQLGLLAEAAAALVDRGDARSAARADPLREGLAQHALHVCLAWFLALGHGDTRDPAALGKLNRCLDAAVASDSPAIASTGRLVLQHVLLHLHTFGRAGASQLFPDMSAVDEDATSATAFGAYGTPRLFSLGDDRVVEVCDLVGGSGRAKTTRAVRVVMRTAAGRWAWEWEEFDEASINLAARVLLGAPTTAPRRLSGVMSPPPSLSEVTSPTLAPQPDSGAGIGAASGAGAGAPVPTPIDLAAGSMARPDSPPPPRPSDALTERAPLANIYWPEFSEQVAQDPQSDMLAQLLRTFEEQCPEVREARAIARAAVTAQSPADLPSEATEIAALEARSAAAARAVVAALPRAAEQFQNPAVPVLGTPPANPLEFTWARGLISELGLLAPGVRDRVMLLDGAGNRLARDLTELDAMIPRQVIKAGVLYVGPGQETDLEVLSNTRGSAVFEKFVAALGWDVPLADHRGYGGGMSRTILADGPTTPYHANATSEVVFHVATRLPIDPEWPGHELKKRLIAVDEIQVIFSEDNKDYWVRTVAGFATQFFIVIYPLRSGLFRVQTVADPDWDAVVGPLFDGAVVPGFILASLVRDTVRCAAACIAERRRDLSPLEARADRLAKIIKEHALGQVVSPQHLVGALISPTVATNTTKKTAAMGFTFTPSNDPIPSSGTSKKK